MSRSRRALLAPAVLGRRGGVAVLLAAACVISLGGTGPVSAATPAGPGVGSGSQRTTAPVEHRVTLVTGDVVRVTTGPGSSSSVSLEPRPDGSMPQAAVTRERGHVHVVPVEAFGLLAAGRLDRDLFDVTGLIAAGYDDAATAELPLIVDYGRGALAAAQARASSLTAAERTVTVPRLGMAAFHADKDRGRTVWRSLTAGSGEGGPTRLASGAAHVYLDGRVEATLEDSVPQIHAPEAWDAGYDGTGATVAVLDTGYDPTHPDLEGRVVDSANFTSDASVVDGNGHGTHVASTIAGSGAASDGLRRGVAPGANLLVGKVLGDDGSGADSGVLAGMVWAVDHHADVVNMSLGGDVDDGTNPLSQAIDELSQTSATLFVVAAGNNGPDPSTVTTPGSAAAALTVGAVDDDDAMASFSGRGPLVRSGGLKPEVTAPGVGIVAARAAGTALGEPVDEHYTSLSGTSMATPHVAGVAALVKEEHPGWDGEQVKEAIVTSAVPVGDASGFDAGAGRVDALRAVDAEVLAPATVSLGFYAWPYSDLDPTSTTLTWTNPRDTPVTLDLALAGEDGTPVVDGSMGMAADQVVVPAHGEASADVVLDPTVADPGAYSAVVTATRADDGATVRTVVGYVLESERYDLTVHVVPRSGSQWVSHQVAVSSFGEPWTFEQRTVDATSEEVTMTFRVPPGTYSVGDLGFGLAADGAREGVVSYDPSVEVSGDTEVVLDENDAARFDYDVDRPVVDDGAILDLSWQTDAGLAGYLWYGAADRVFAQSSTGLDGTGGLAVNWLLSQPEGTLTAPGEAPVGLRPVPRQDQASYRVDVPRLEGRFRLVDAGSADAPRTAGVDGAVAVLSSDCDALDAAVAALQDAGAVGLITYPAPGSDCVGTVPADAGLPALQVRPWQAEALTDQHEVVAIAVRDHPRYLYDLTHHYASSVPDGAVLSGTGRSVAAVVERYRGLGSTSADGLTALEELVAWIPSRDGAANVGLVRAMPFPSTVTHYVSTGSGARWERKVSILDTTYGGEYATMYAPRRAFAGGSTTSDTWFGGPVGSRVSPLQQLTNGAPPPVREDGWLYLSQGAFTDAAGHWTNSDLFTPEYDGRIYVDGELRYRTSWSVFMNTSVPDGTHDIVVRTDVHRENAFWQRSTEVRTRWAFVSRQPSGARAVLPMLGASYRMRLSATGTSAPGRFRFRVSFAMPAGVATRPLARRSLGISWDHGATWRPAALSRCSRTACTVTVGNRAGRSASLRVAGTDDRGRSVRQTVVDAYAVRSR